MHKNSLRIYQCHIILKPSYFFNISLIQALVLQLSTKIVSNILVYIGDDVCPIPGIKSECLQHLQILKLKLHVGLSKYPRAAIFYHAVQKDFEW